MNSITQAIASIASVLGIGSSLVSQGMIIHREAHPLQQQAQMQTANQQCLLPDNRLGKLVVIVNAAGERQLACVLEPAQ